MSLCSEHINSHFGSHRGRFADGESTPFNLREVEAEAVLRVFEIEAADYCRGYVQNWRRRGSGFDGDTITKRALKKIFRAVDQIIRAGVSELSEYAKLYTSTRLRSPLLSINVACIGLSRSYTTTLGSYTNHMARICHPIINHNESKD